jgi:hypothetical protein
MGDDGVPVGNGFTYLGGSLVGATISNGTGFITTGCAVGNTYSSSSPCTDTAFSIRVIPAEFNSGQNDVCTGSDSYTTTPNVAVTCSFSNGLTTNAQPGTVTSGTVVGSGCSNWTIKWTQANSRLYYIDKNPLNGANVGFVLYGTDIGFSFSDYVHTQAGDTWRVSATLAGKGASSAASYSSAWTIQGTAAVLLGNCGLGGRPTQFTLTDLTAAATVTQN